MNKSLKEFLCGAFGTVCILLLRGLPAIPWVVRNGSHWGAIGFVFTLMGGFCAVIWDDEHPFRAFYFGLTVIPLLSALTRQ
jgi:hypothetical protein